MRLRLTPTDNSFYVYFISAADNLCLGAALLKEMVSPDAQRSVVAGKLRDAEHANDEVTHALFRQLNATFVTPFDREDMHRLASRLDDVMDFMEAAGDLILLYEVKTLPYELGTFVDVLTRCAETTAAAMRRLRGLHGLEDYWIEVNRLENEADQLHRKVLVKLFGGEYDALTVLKLKEVVDQFEAAADAFEHVAAAVETIVVKES